MNHKQKLTTARKMMSQEEIKNHVPPFQSLRWTERKENIEYKLPKKRGEE
jgi:hypothetical protein